MQAENLLSWPLDDGAIGDRECCGTDPDVPQNASRLPGASGPVTIGTAVAGGGFEPPTGEL